MARYSGSEAGGRNVRICENRRHSTGQVRVGSGEFVLFQNIDKGLQSLGGIGHWELVGLFFSNPVFSVTEG